jgi:replicative DNA helicase
MSEKPLPADINAERAFLGSILLDRDAILSVADRVRPEHCYVEKHAWIYEAALACFHRRQPPDLIGVADELRRRERLEAVGGPAYLIELSNSTPTATHIIHYGRIVKRTAMARRLITAGGRIAALGFDETSDPDAMLNKASLELAGVQDGAGPKVAPGEAVLDATIDELMGTNGPKQASPSTGIYGLDDIISLGRGKLMLIAGRPGAGKSTIIGPIQEAWLGQGHQVLVYSGEMKRGEIMRRWISRKTGIPMKVLTDQELDAGQQQAVAEAAGEIAPLITYHDEDGVRRSRWHVMDEPATIQEIERTALRLRHQNPQPLLVIIDHIGLVEPFPGTKPNDLYVNTTLNSKACKQMAMNGDCAVIALVQMNREIEARGADAKPRLSDLRESGSLEQDADIIAFLMRSASFVYAQENAATRAEREALEGIVHLYIEKNRNGSTGMANLMTHFARFEMRG